MHNKVRREICVAASTVTLRGSGEIESLLGQKIVFDVEAGLIDFLGGVSDEGAEKIGRHAGVKVLADLESDFHFLA